MTRPLAHSEAALHKTMDRGGWLHRALAWNGDASTTVLIGAESDKHLDTRAITVAETVTERFKHRT